MDWHERILELTCRWLLQTESRDNFPPDCLFLFGNPDLFRPSVIEGVLKNIRRAGAFYIGTYKNREICYVTPKLGAPAVSIYLEALSKTSVERIIALGFAGGLREGYKVGDCFLPLDAFGQDGTSQSYFQNLIESSPLDTIIQKKIENQLTDLGIRYHAGSIISIDTLTTESDIMVRDFREKKFDAVDMETGLFVSLCKRLDLTCGAVHILTDNAYSHEIDPGGKIREVYHHLLRGVLEVFRKQ